MTYLETLIYKTRKMLHRWHGRPAAMLELTKSLSTLAIIVYGDQYGSNLIVACFDPEFICGPTRWTNSKVEIRITKLETGEEGIEVIDPQNGVRIKAASFEVKENVKV